MIKYVWLSVFLACGTVPTATEAVPASASVAEDGIGTKGPLALTVITATDSTTRLPGADVFVIHSTGRVERVGVTDQIGRVDIALGPFLSKESPAIGVMVCHPVFYCGVLRTEYVAPRREATIALATVVTR